MTIVEVPLPVNVTLSGFLVRVQVPVAGNPPTVTPPVGIRQSGCTVLLSTGAPGRAPTVREYVAVAAEQGEPRGLLVVMVIVIIFPASDTTGVYTKEKGDVLVEAGITVPPPSSVIVTLVALTNVLPLTVTGVTPQVLPDVLLRANPGGDAHPHETANEGPVVVHSDAFLTVIV